MNGTAVLNAATSNIGFLRSLRDSGCDSRNDALVENTWHDNVILRDAVFRKNTGNGTRAANFIGSLISRARVQQRSSEDAETPAE